jgi:hypothetical protein
MRYSHKRCAVAHMLRLTALFPGNVGINFCIFAGVNFGGNP